MITRFWPTHCFVTEVAGSMTTVSAMAFLSIGPLNGITIGSAVATFVLFWMPLRSAATMLDVDWFWR